MIICYEFRSCVLLNIYIYIYRTNRESDVEMREEWRVSRHSIAVHVDVIFKVILQEVKSCFLGNWWRIMRSISCYLLTGHRGTNFNGIMPYPLHYCSIYNKKPFLELKATKNASFKRCQFWLIHESCIQDMRWGEL